MPLDGRHNANDWMLMDQKMPTRSLASFTATAERRLLNAICGRLPAWVTPNGLTLLGLAGAVLVFTGLVLGDRSNFYLLLAIFGFVVNWFGDSLDGSVARFRKIERPRFGTFIDSSADLIVIFLVFAGIGLSAWVRFEISALLLVVYLLITFFSHLQARVTGIYQISFDGVGPTEARLMMIAVIVAMMALPPVPVVQWFGGLTLIDIGLAAFTIGAYATWARMAAATALRLAKDDPPRSPAAPANE